MSANESQERFERVLSLFFSTTGFGYALMEGPTDVKTKGIKYFKPVGNPNLWEELTNLINILQPERVVLENAESSSSHKRERISKLFKRLKAFLEGMNMPYSLYDRDQIRIVFELWRAKSKYEIALVISKSIPAFQNYLYEKPKFPKTEHYRTVVFDAAALGITHYYVST
jgi:hypothetical protein